MKRYVRTKDGKIIDCEQHCCLLGVITTDEIIKQSNNIFDLIEVGDFIIAKDNIAYSGLVEEILLDCCEEKLFNLGLHCYIYYTRIAELYTKQGNDYILVWDKDKGVI